MEKEIEARILKTAKLRGKDIDYSTWFWLYTLHGIGKLYNVDEKILEDFGARLLLSYPSLTSLTEQENNILTNFRNALMNIDTVNKIGGQSL